MRVCIVVLYGAVLWANSIHQYHCKSASLPKAEAFLARFNDKDVEAAIDQIQPCRGAKCECTDRELKTRFYTTVGHVVSNCRMKEMYDGLYNTMEDMYLELYEHTSDKESDADNQQDDQDAGMSPRDHDLDQHDAVCEMMTEIGQKYQEGAYDEEVSSCCDYKERIVTFQCLHVYMTQAELRVAESRYTNFVENADVSKDEIVAELETEMVDACDAIFGSMGSLVQGIERHLAGQGGTTGVSSHHDHDDSEEEGLSGGRPSIFDWTDNEGKGGKVSKEGKKKGGKKSKEGRGGKKGGKKSKAADPSEGGNDVEEEGAAANNELGRAGKAGKKSGKSRKTGEDGTRKGGKKNKGEKGKGGKKGGKKNKATDSSDGVDDASTMGSDGNDNRKSELTDEGFPEYGHFYKMFNDRTDKRDVMEAPDDADLSNVETESLIDKLMERLKQH